MNFFDSSVKRAASRRGHRLAAGMIALALAFPVVAAEYIAIPGGAYQSVLPTADTPLDVIIKPMSMRAEPVTNAEFLAFVRSHPQWRRDKVAGVFAESRYLDHWMGDQSISDAQARQPIVKVSWFAAQAYCESEDARLPSWHEWEYVAAADETHRDARNDPAWRNRILGWYSKTSNGDPEWVGGAPNAYGVRDLHGLVWEWVDDFNALFVSADNRNQGDPDLLKFCGAGALSMQDRDNYAVLMRIAMLSSLKGADVTGNVGFRCVRPDQETTP
ncbi:MAG TPA: formylglycine-generating enzyme family protein [Dokdonella sp.]|uniref:formylglycine-generating enzyme family protein n=1 Tax=Dokdonella sp. TaxID=2291710 RepID=UPI002D7F3BC9|nr:formylglycine-generating enzyme family protein [Dokdonella sp.]HET9034426.1 formylglycine-generating enzyme family protein [Dokdonella sp.]